MAQDPWDFLPDDDQDDSESEDAAEAAALHVETEASDPDQLDDPPPPDDERGPLGYWLDDEEPESPSWSGLDPAGDEADGEGGSDGEDRGVDDQDDVETLLERQHYAFSSDTDSEADDEDEPTPRTTAARATANRATSRGTHEPTLGPDQLRDLLVAERSRLVELRDTVRHNGDDDRGADSTGDLSHAHQHVADLATETYEREVELSIAHEVDDELAEVERAISRLGTQASGRCEACGVSIGTERLEALPATRWCRAHASA